MDDLARVNLLVGMNNSGKTALLEGLHLLASGGDPGSLREAAKRRGEVILQPDEMELIDISHFFHGHTLSLGASFELRGDNSVRPVIVKIIEINETIMARGPKGPERKEGLPYPALRVEGGQRNSSVTGQFRLIGDSGVSLDIGPRLRRPPLVRRSEVATPVQYIGTESLGMQALAAMWDDVTVARRESEVNASLRIIEKEIESVHFLTGMFAYGYSGSRAGVVVDLPRESRRMPLGSLGEGMRRMLALSISLITSSKGWLFIDEIDTGLHYSVLKDMWSLVVKTAKQFDMQVFAATHSWDCIEALGKFCGEDSEHASEVAIHKITRELNRSVAFPGTDLPRVVENQTEIRG